MSQEEVRGTTTRVGLTLVLLALVLIAALIVLKPSGDTDILVLCGGSMRAALEEVIQRYKNVSDDSVVATYGGSGVLCAQIENTGRGDVYICHDPFMEWAAGKGLIDEWTTVGRLDVVIIVPKANPRNINGLKDLAQPGLRVGLGDQTYSTSGVIANHLLNQLEYGDDIRKNVRMETHSHQSRCEDVKLGHLDASIVWGAVAGLYADALDLIPVPRDKIDTITSATFGVTDLKNIRVTVGIISQARDRTNVRRFYEFATYECLDIFEKYGFRPGGN